MSCVEVYYIDSKGDVRMFAEAHNAFGGAMLIWMAIKEKYDIQTSFFDWAPVWRLAGLNTTPQHERIVLAFTFDNVWVKKENIQKLIDALSQFESELPADRKGNNSTLQQLLEIFRKANSDSDVHGLCFNQTSVNGNPWRKQMLYAEAVETIKGMTPDRFAEERPERRFNFNRDKEIDGRSVWELFESRLIHQ